MNPAMRIEAAKFEVQPGPTVPLAKVRAVEASGASWTFCSYFQAFFFESSLQHPTKGDERYAAVQGTTARYRLIRGVWSTYGHLNLEFYSSMRLQVRAKMRWSNKPLEKEPSATVASRISWHLDETAIILPALIESAEQFSFAPLQETKLFEDEFPLTPDQQVSIWSIKGSAAPYPAEH